MDQLGRDSVTLAAAVKQFRDISGYANAYQWYRRQASEGGRVSFGGCSVRTEKVGNRWMADPADVRTALATFDEEIKERHRATLAYAAGVLEGGGRVETDWGWYEARGAFHLANFRQAKPSRGGQEWYCSTCLKPASLERNRAECHRCSDWGSCGGDCTISAVKCDECGTRRNR